MGFEPLETYRYNYQTNSCEIFGPNIKTQEKSINIIHVMRFEPLETYRYNYLTDS